jgi:IS4 transposase
MPTVFFSLKRLAGALPNFLFFISAELVLIYALFVWTYQQNQQPSSSVFLSQQTSEQCFQHNKPAKRTGR